MYLENFLFACFGGIFPALVWLWFWLKEDRLHPEPRRILILTFLGGMITVPLVLPFQKYVLDYGFTSPLIMFVLWAFMEEFFKFISSWFFALKQKNCDEPIDAMIYLITTALGFAALENVLFLINPLSLRGIEQIIITGNLRFMGATLLHVISSAVIGIAIAFSFYKTRTIKLIYIICGLLVATLLHTIFNLLIIEYINYPAFSAFIGVWIAVIVLMFLFEKVKLI